MIWDRKRIVARIKKLYRQGLELSYNALARREQSLVSAAAYHFGSYRKAVEAAGIDYAAVTRRPRWTRQNIIQEIKKARRKGEDLHWSAVTQRRDELGRAAFAALQPRLFGTWNRALHAAGLDSDEISRYRTWDSSSIAAELRARAREGDPLNSGALQKNDPGLHAAAVRHFGSYDAALRAGGIDPAEVRQRRAWTRKEVLQQLKTLHGSGESISDSAVRRAHPALYGAAVRLYGSFTAARKVARLPSPQQTRRTAGKKSTPRAASGAARTTRKKKTKKKTARR
jgi:hypothetical protein